MQKVTKVRRLNQNILPAFLNASIRREGPSFGKKKNEVIEVASKCFGTQSMKSEDESNDQNMRSNKGQKKKDQDIQEVERQISKHALSGNQLKNIAINFSIIKQNEFKSMMQVADVGVEALEFSPVHDLEQTQDHQMNISSQDRNRRSVFLEEINLVVPYFRFSDQYAIQYGQQIFKAFPEKDVEKRINDIMEMDEPHDQKSTKQQLKPKKDKSTLKSEVATDTQVKKEDKDQQATKKTKKQKQAPSDLVQQIKVENRTFEDQQQIRKVLLTEAGQDSASGSDRESDLEEITESTFQSSRKEGDQIGEYSKRQNRIFQHITIMDKNITLPLRPEDEELKMTLFIEPDDFLLHTFICNENFGYLSNPASKDPEFEFFIEEIRQPVLVYMRDHWKDFMEFLKENDEFFEPVIYTSGLKPYTERILKILDPDNEEFKYKLYQNACYIFEVKEENILFLIKDISRFKNRNIKRSLLLDSKAQNYMMTPENCIPISEYTAESVDPKQLEGYAGNVEPEKDQFLLELMGELDEYKDLEDVRPVIHKKYNIRQLLKNSKLI